MVLKKENKSTKEVVMYDKKSLLTALMAIINFLGRVPAREEMIGKKPSLPTYEKFFGSFENALSEAQGKTFHKGAKEKIKRVSRRERLIGAINVRVEKLGRVPYQKEFSEKGSEPSYRSLVREFGSFSAALRAAGINQQLGGREARTEAEKKMIIDELIKFVNNHQHLPNKADINNHPVLPSYIVLEEIFGSIEGALKATGIISPYGRVVAKYFHGQMLQKLRALDVIADGNPLGRHCNEIAKMGLMFCEQTYYREFGSFEKALEKARALE